jgi:hypothetical protein
MFYFLSDFLNSFVFHQKFLQVLLHDSENMNDISTVRMFLLLTLRRGFREVCYSSSALKLVRGT